MKLGNSYSIPKFRLAHLLNDAKKMYERFKLEDTQTDFIASLLGQSASSGGFFQKVADLRAYGLIEGRGGKTRVTKLGFEATHGIDSERDLALEKSVKNIPLWAKLYEKYGAEIRVENFWMDLEKITGMERLDAQAIAEQVKKAYNEDARFIRRSEEALSSHESNNTDPQNEGSSSKVVKTNISQPSSDSIGYIGFPEYSKAPFEIKDQMSLNIAKQILEAIGERINRKERTNYNERNEIVNKSQPLNEISDKFDS